MYISLNKFIVIILFIPMPLSARPIPNCGIPLVQNPVAVLNSKTVGGDVQAAAITLAKGVDISLTDSLTVISNGDLNILGNIVYDDSSDKTIDIILISLNGDINIYGKVGMADQFAGQELDGTDVYKSGFNPKAIGGDALDSGNIKMVALRGNIDISDDVKTGKGGDGGYGNATGIIWPIAILEEVDPEKSKVIGKGGNGGDGGHIKVCAEGAIFINGARFLYAGNGGDGGSGYAYSLSGQITESQGGPGGHGGHINFEGLGIPAQPTVISIAGNVGAGNGGDGGSSTAQIFANIFGNGPDATAIGGIGGNSETVTFTNLQGGASTNFIDAGMAGEGGDAKALAGDGGFGFTQGASTIGGDATATGGNGGKIAPIPLIQNGTVNKRDPSLSAKGGNAIAIAGFGGPPNSAAKGKTGVAVASGGIGGGLAQGGPRDKKGPLKTKKNRPKAKSLGSEDGI